MLLQQREEESDTARATSLVEAVMSWRGAKASFVDAIVFTDADLNIIGPRPQLPDYLVGIVEVSGIRLTSLKRDNAARLTATIAEALALPVGRSAPFKLRTNCENLFLFGTVERAPFKDTEALFLFSFVHPDARKLPRADDLMTWLSLSKTEAAIGLAIAGGEDVAAIAKGRSLSELTVRTHLRTIFEKTRTHSQRDLVALLLRLGAL